MSYRFNQVNPSEKQNRSTENKQSIPSSQKCLLKLENKDKAVLQKYETKSLSLELTIHRRNVLKSKKLK